MFTLQEIQQLKSALPSNGIREITLRSKISRPTVSKFFKGYALREINMLKIWKTGWDLVREVKEEEANLRQYAKSVMNDQY